MATALAPATPVQPAGAENTGSGAGLTWVRRIGWVLLGLQLAALLAYSTVEYQRYALSWDFAIYHQAWHLIGHGNLYPFDTANQLPFLATHGELYMWPLALLGLVHPQGITMLWAQALATVGAGVVAFRWILDLVSSPGWSRRFPPHWAAATGLALLMLNPWVYWADAFDFHSEAFGVLFVLLAARALYRERRAPMWLWAALALSVGDVAGTYVVGLGIIGVLSGRRLRRPGLALIVVAGTWVVALSLLGLNKGSDLASGYGYLAVGAASSAQVGLGSLATGIADHPGRVLGALWAHRTDIWANLAPSGLIGVLTPIGLGVALVVLAANNLNSYIVFAVPGFQSLALYAFVTVGTVVALGWLARRRRWARIVPWLAAVLVLNCALWAAVWLPRLPSTWVRVSPAAASVLHRAAARIPSSAEVVASQGVAGRFSGRRLIEAVLGPGALPIATGDVFFVLAPYQGIQTASVSSELGLLAELAGSLHAHLVDHGSGVWVFRWRPPSGTREVTVPSSVPTVPAWALPGGPSSSPVVFGPPASWHAASTGRPGYVADQAYWREPPGHYRAGVSLSATGPVTVEVRNVTGHVLLARREVQATDGPAEVLMDVHSSRVFPEPVYRGEGPFLIHPVPPPAHNQLEVRVWTAGGASVNVYSIELIPSPAR